MFLCTGNASRSQMAEGLARAYYGDVLDVYSSGSRFAGWVHPLAIRALADLGIDISDQESKSSAKFINEPFDVVVTVCDSAAKDCPVWPNAKRIEHWPIEDPSWGDDDEEMRYFRFLEKRDEIKGRLDELMKTLDVEIDK